jgi:hypothetical protein
MQHPRETLTDDDVSALLRSIDRAPPVVRVEQIMAQARARHSRRNVLIAAAAILATATAAAATVPSFVMHTFGHHAQSNHLPRSATPVQVPATATSARGIAFEPREGVHIEFTVMQATGNVRVRSTDESSVQITQTSSNSEAQFALTPDGVVVDNSGSIASYEIAIPATLHKAVVSIAQRIVYARNGARRRCSGRDDPEQGCTIVMGQ